MNVEFFSTTLIQGIEKCPDSAVTQHMQRLKHGNDNFGSNPTRFGTIVHEVAEIAHRYDLEGDACPPPIEIFDKVWRDHFLTDFDYHEMGRDGIQAFIDRTLYERRGTTIATEWKFLLDIVEMQVWPIGDLNKKEIKKLIKTIDSRGGVPVISTIDRIDRVSKTELDVFDYKTNFLPYSRDEVEGSIQLKLYHMAVHAHWPETEYIDCTFDLLRHGRQSTHFDEVTIESTRAYLINLWHQVKSWDRAPASLNAYCCYCEKRTVCPLYIKATEGLLIDAWAPGEGVGMSELFDEYEHLKSVAKIVDKRAGEFSAAIVARIMKNEGKPLEIDEESEAFLQPNPRYEYPIDAVIPTLQAHKAISLLKYCGSVSRPQLDRHLKGRGKLQEEIEGLLETKYVKPTLKRRKKK